MTKAILSILLVISLVLSGCGQKTTGQQVTSIVQTTTQQISTSLPELSAENRIGPVPATTTIIASTKEFTVEGDDKGLYPSSLAVKSGDMVKITFKVRTDNVYYGGLSFRSNYFNTGSIKPGDSNTVDFTADKTFTFTSYWPSSNVKKADGTVLVN